MVALDGRLLSTVVMKQKRSMTLILARRRHRPYPKTGLASQSTTNLRKGVKPFREVVHEEVSSACKPSAALRKLALPNVRLTNFYHRDQELARPE